MSCPPKFSGGVQSGALWSPFVFPNEIAGSASAWDRSTWSQCRNVVPHTFPWSQPFPKGDSHSLHINIKCVEREEKQQGFNVLLHVSQGCACLILYLTWPVNSSDLALHVRCLSWVASFHTMQSLYSYHKTEWRSWCIWSIIITWMPLVQGSMDIQV